MPLKEVTGPAKSKGRKPPAKAKSKKAPPPKVPRRRLTSESSPEPSSKDSRKRTASESSLSPVPEYNLNITTQAARYKRRFKLTRASLYDESINEKSIAERFGMLDPDSFSKHTWGDPMDDAIPASTKRKTWGFGKRSSKKISVGIAQAFVDMMDDMKGVPRTIIPNTPNRSPLLRLSLEIREVIYGYLLTYPNPILVKYDWQTTDRNPYNRHAIIRTCKQLYEEGSAFLYRTNIIQAVFRKPIKSFSLYEEPFMISSSFLSHFRNVIIDCSQDSWNLGWFDKAAKSIEILSKSKAIINSLTLVVIPQRVGMSSTAVGMETNPTTFADFLWYPGDVMESLRDLAPREFNVIVRKGATKRLLISVDLRHLEAIGQQRSELMNIETFKSLAEKERKVDEELMGLKDRFEEIFEDDAWAIREGMCTLISEG